MGMTGCRVKPPKTEKDAQGGVPASATGGIFGLQMHEWV